MKYLTQSKTYVLPVLLLFLGSSAMAQKDEKKLRIGLKFAPSITWIKPDAKTLSKGKTGFGYTYGLMVDYNFATNYAFNFGVDVTNLRSSIKVDMIDSVQNVSIKYNLRYLDIPLSLKLKTREIGYITYYGTFGITPGFLIRSRADYDPFVKGNGTEDDNKDVDVNEKRNDFSESNSSITQDDASFIRIPLSIGAGIEYGLSGSTSMMVGLRFDNGFTDIMADKNAKAQNKYLALNLGFFF